ncbi:MAG: alpha-amylase, partial [Oligoflexales bacterium]|nr:alpha-amylase [Oligoflexales bacterium]
GKVFARGRDPFFPAWPDVLQLNAFGDGHRKAVVETLSKIAQQSDGVRCDMAMLMMNQTFERTWGHCAGERPAEEYWTSTISTIKKKFSDFLFMAEAYWDLEWELQQQGFDYCYDKRLYDRLEHDSTENVNLHLLAESDYQNRLTRFLENHDEPRAASAFPWNRDRAAAVTTYMLPGAKLFHEGQFVGKKIRLPVFLGRSPIEPDDSNLLDFYRTLVKASTHEAIRSGIFQLCERSGWPDNESYRNLVAFCWHETNHKLLIITNLSDSSAQGFIWPPSAMSKGGLWKMTDLFTGRTYEHHSDDKHPNGVFVDLPARGYHVFDIR